MQTKLSHHQHWPWSNTAMKKIWGKQSENHEQCKQTLQCNELAETTRKSKSSTQTICLSPLLSFPQTCARTHQTAHTYIHTYLHTDRHKFCLARKKHAHHHCKNKNKPPHPPSPPSPALSHTNKLELRVDQCYKKHKKHRVSWKIKTHDGVSWNSRRTTVFHM